MEEGLLWECVFFLGDLFFVRSIRYRVDLGKIRDC